jgi:hypothetical protein
MGSAGAGRSVPELPERAEASLLLRGGRPARRLEETDFPAIDVFETPADLVIEAELPGVDPGEIGVIASEGLIIIEGEKQEDPGPGRVNFLCMERSFGVPAGGARRGRRRLARDRGVPRRPASGAAAEGRRKTRAVG